MMMMMMMMMIRMLRQWTETKRLAPSLREHSTSVGGKSRLKQLLSRFIIITLIIVIIIIEVVIIIVVVIFTVNAIDFSCRVLLSPSRLEAFNTSPSLSLS